MNQVAVIDYGMGNLHSVAKAIEHVGAELAAESGQAKVTITSILRKSRPRISVPRRWCDSRLHGRDQPARRRRDGGKCDEDKTGAGDLRRYAGADGLMKKTVEWTVWACCRGA